MSTTRSRWTRRDVLRLGAAAGSVVLWRPVFCFAANPVEEVDHIILAVSDLDQGIATIEEKTGVRAVFGGVHPGRGTRNALMSLGDRCYLEILSTDPNQPGAKTESTEFIRNLTEPEIVGWAAATRDMDVVVRGVREAKMDLAGPRAGSRQKPDGTTLTWETISVGGHDRTIVPFVIQWGETSTHPSEDSPRGATLLELQLEHPDADQINPYLRAMGLSTRSLKGTEPKITAIIDSPNGLVTLTS